MPKFFNQKGLVPLVIIAIVGAVIVGVALLSKGNFRSKNPDQNTFPKEPTQQTEKSQKSSNTSRVDSGLSIQTPEGWTRKENPNPRTQLAFFSPKEGQDDKFIENVSLEVIDLSTKPNISLDETVKIWNDQNKSDFPDSYQVVSQEQTTLDGVAAIRIISKAKDKISPLKSEAVIALRDGKAYVLIYSAEGKSFDKFLPDFNKIIASFKFGKMQVEWQDYKNDQYGYSLKYPKGWVVKDQSGSDRREVLIVHPQNLANAMIAARKDDTLKDKASMEKAIAARKEFKQSESGFKMTNFTSQVEEKKGGWAMIGEKTIDDKKWAVMERGLLDIYGKVLIQQSGYILDEGKDYKDVVVQVLDSFKVE